MEKRPIQGSVTEVKKGWGKEVIFAREPAYCGKLLCFNKRTKFSMHFHKNKDETFYVTEGTFQLNWIDTKDATIHSEVLNVGDTWRVPPLLPHQVTCISNGGTIIEVSTHDNAEDEDNFRVGKGDNQ